MAANKGGGSTKLIRLPCETRFAGNVILMTDVLEAWPALELMLTSEDLKELIGDEEILNVSVACATRNLRLYCQRSLHWDEGVQELYNEVSDLAKKRALVNAMATLTPIFEAITRIEADMCDSTAPIFLSEHNRLDFAILMVLCRPMLSDMRPIWKQLLKHVMQTQGVLNMGGANLEKLFLERYNKNYHKVKLSACLTSFLQYYFASSFANSAGI